MKQDNGTNQAKATSEDTSGPFFPIYFQDESLEDLTVLGRHRWGSKRSTYDIWCSAFWTATAIWPMGFNGVLAGECKGHLQLAC